MDLYFDHLYPELLGRLILKIDYNSFKALKKLINLDNLNYLYLTSLRYGEHMKEIAKEFPTIGLHEYELILCSLKIKMELKIEDLTLEEICSIDEITADNRGIKGIPNEIENLTNLRALFLSDNQIKEIPKEIGNLVNLSVLVLDRNQIKEIPKEIGNFGLL